MTTISNHLIGNEIEMQIKENKRVTVPPTCRQNDCFDHTTNPPNNFKIIQSFELTFN